MRGECSGKDGSSFAAVLKAIPDGGTCQLLGEYLLLKDASSVTLLLAAETTFRQEDPELYTKLRMEELSRIPYETLLVRHTSDYNELFSRVSLNLSKSSDRHDGPTDERLQQFQRGEEDPELIETYFQFGRYLLISSSRPGSLPANLQGIWNDSFTPPWDSKFTININAQMNYWLAENCNLAECHEPLFDLIERMREPGRITAQKMYDCRGLPHIIIRIFGQTRPLRIPTCQLPSGRWALLGYACIYGSIIAIVRISIFWKKHTKP